MKELITTDYIKCCLEHDLIVTKCYKFFCQENSQRCKDIFKFVPQDRRTSDVDESFSVIAETTKLIDNNAYGIQLSNKDKIEHPLTFDEMKVDRYINFPKSRNYGFVDEKTHPKRIAKKIGHIESILVGILEFNNAKDQMLDFCFDFLGRTQRR